MPCSAAHAEGLRFWVPEAVQIQQGGSVGPWPGLRRAVQDYVAQATPERVGWSGHRQAPGKRAELALQQCRSGMIDWELPASAR